MRPIASRREQGRFNGWLALGAFLTVTALVRPAYAADGKEGVSSVSVKTSGVKLPYIDQMLKDSWQSAGVKPSAFSRDDEFVRRAYLDVLGRIPNIAEARAFLSSKEQAKRVKLVEYLLAHPDYAKNMATQWKVTLIGRGRPDRNVDPRALTDWLRKQFAANRPWNEMALELITAKGSNKENGAVNYTMSHLEGGAVPLTSLTTRVFLSQQIQCTQCHDHPSNDWKQADFWGINAFLKGIRTKDFNKEDTTGAEVYDHTELTDAPTDDFSTYERRDARMGVVFPTFLDGRKISQGKDVNRREALGKFITGADNEAFPKAMVNRVWTHLMGRGFVNPVDDFGPHNNPSHPELLDRLGKDFKESGYNVKQLIRWIMNSDAYQLTSSSIPANEKDESLFTHMTLKPMTPEQLFDSLLVATAAHKAGSQADSDKRRDEWLRQFQFAFANDEGDESTSFQGTIPQALMMMNGDLMAQAVGGKSGSFLADLLEQSQLQRRQPIGEFVVQHLYLAALSRAPSPREFAMAQGFLGSNPDSIPVMEDIFWALLNSNEFILNR